MHSTCAYNGCWPAPAMTMAEGLQDGSRSSSHWNCRCCSSVSDRPPTPTTGRAAATDRLTDCYTRQSD